MCSLAQFRSAAIFNRNVKEPMTIIFQLRCSCRGTSNERYFGTANSWKLSKMAKIRDVEGISAKNFPALRRKRSRGRKPRRDFPRNEFFDYTPFVISRFYDHPKTWAKKWSCKVDRRPRRRRKQVFSSRMHDVGNGRSLARSLGIKSLLQRYPIARSCGCLLCLASTEDDSRLSRLRMPLML